MIRFIKASLLVLLVLFPLFGYTFLKGAEWGVDRYRHSRQFFLTLYSMYMYGLSDGCTDPKTCKGHAFQPKAGGCSE